MPTSTYDQFYGRIVGATATVTDTYSEVNISLPTIVSTTSKSSDLYVPVIKQVDFLWQGSLGGLSADASLLAALSLGDVSLWTSCPAAGIADPNCVAYWAQYNALTTSGEVIFNPFVSFVMPGDGVIVTASTLTLHQQNTATGVATTLATRIWYDFVIMSEMTYMRALHSLGI